MCGGGWAGAQVFLTVTCHQLIPGQLPKPVCSASPARLSPLEPHLLCQAEASGLFLESGPSPDTGSRLRRLRPPPLSRPPSLGGMVTH